MPGASGGAAWVGDGVAAGVGDGVAAGVGDGVAAGVGDGVATRGDSSAARESLRLGVSSRDAPGADRGGGAAAPPRSAATREASGRAGVFPGAGERCNETAAGAPAASGCNLPTAGGRGAGWESAGLDA
jgi:hypothetical protein